jgi:putative transposase
MGGPRGYDGGKKIKGRKRHLLVDTQGNLLKNSVLPADIHDRAGAEILLSDLQHLFPAIRLVWADTAYRGLRDWLHKALGWRLSIPQHFTKHWAGDCPSRNTHKALGWRLSIPQHWWTGGVWMRVGAEPPTRPSGFQVLARRWIVERTIAWLTTNRRLAKDYERFVETGEMLLYLAMSRILLRRLTSKRER